MGRNRFARRGILALLICLGGIAAPASAAELRSLCPDRPGKGTSPCTLDQGHFQVEVDGFDTTTQHSGGASLRTLIAGAPILKYGLTNSVDVEAGWAPYLEQHVRAGGSATTLSGQGDLYLRAKWNFLGGGGPFAAVIEPFVKAATASRGLGNGALEGGIVLPFSRDLGDDWSLASTPEVDFLQNASGTGRHATAIDVIGLGRTLEDGIGLGAEVWTSQDFDPAGTTSQYSFDLDMAWQPPADGNIQFDAGVNLGLNAGTPGAQLYFGFSQRI